MSNLEGDIDRLIAKFLAGETTPEETIHLNNWLEETDLNKRIFYAAEITWALHSRVQYIKPNKEKIYQSIVDSTAITKKTIFTPLRLAACIVVLLSVSAGVYHSLKKNDGNALRESEWITKISEHNTSSVLLSEGSSITMNGNSRLSYPQMFENNRRTISLVGEAFFKVTPDPNRPFIISLDAVEVKVVGTSFHVSAYRHDSIMQVQVVQGRVMMSHQFDSILIEDGQKGVYDKLTQKLWLEKATTQNHFAYATHTLEFKDQSLQEIIKQISAAYGVTFELENKEINECRLTGTYHEMSLNVMLEVITESLDLRYRIEGNRVYLTGDGCL